VTLFGKYKTVYESLISILEEYGLTEGAAQEEARGIQEKTERVKKLEGLLEQIEEYREQLEDIEQIVKRHITSLNFLDSRMGNVNVWTSAETLMEEERELNFPRLKRWAARIDPQSMEDPYAKRMYVQIKCNQRYLDRKEDEFKKKLAALQETDQTGVESHRRRQEARSRIEALLNSQTFSDFARMLQEANEKVRKDPGETGFPSVQPNSGSCTIPGGYIQLLPVIEELKPLTKQKLGECYDSDANKIILPLEQNLDRETLTVYWSDQMKARSTRNSIQRCLYGMLKSFPLGNLQIRVLDALHYNNSWLGPLKTFEKTAVMDEIPGNEEALLDALKLTVAEFTDIDELLDTEDSVIEYNAKHPDKMIPRKVLVLIGYPEAFPRNASDYVNRILVNHERYGVSLVIYDRMNTRNSNDGGETEQYSDYLNATLICLSSKEETVRRYGSAVHQFRVYPAIQKTPSALKKKVEEYGTKAIEKSYDYWERVGFKTEYTRGKKDIHLRFGVDNRDEMTEISFNNENFAAFLMGASGSGKSTLLHVLITGILQNYHPDDVELWLADFKMSEFAQYANPMPPHVRYILLDESEELVFDLVNRLNTEMRERQQIFKLHGWRNINEVANYYMPVIFVVIDEFSIMSQVLRSNPDYMDLLQNLLAKGRALGFKFIFASQDYSKGIGGLTAMAKDQIQRRIAMKNNYDEIRETLDLRSSSLTEQVRAWMEALPAYYAMVKEHETGTVTRVKTLYFPGKDPTAKQRMLIKELLGKMTSVEYNEQNKGVLKDVNAWIDKHGTVIDGNSFKGYNPSSLKKAAKEYRKQDPCILPEDKLISFGHPRRLLDYLPVSLTAENREHILLVTNRQEYPCAASVIASTSRQFAAQGGKVHIWAFHRDHLFMMNQKAFHSCGQVLNDQEMIFDELHQVRKNINAGIRGNDLYVILGVNLLMEPQGNEGTPSPVSQPFQADNLKELEVSGKRKEEVYKKSRQVIHDDAEDVSSMFGYFSYREEAQNPTSEESVEADLEHKTVSKTYNPEEDLLSVMMNGSRCGYHLFLHVNQYQELKAANIKKDYFRHLLSFRMSNEDSFGFFGNRSAYGLERHICLYSNGMERFTFRPYIHSDVTWDDWIYNEKTHEASQI